jgi:hypothetical protein
MSGVSLGRPLRIFFANFAAKSFLPQKIGSTASGSRGDSCEECQMVSAILAPRKNEFGMGFPEAALAIHKRDARTIAIALVQNSPSRTQPNNLSGND